MYGPERIFSTDQSGFNEAYHTGRTLDIQGQKSVFAEAQSINALTHSYTIQPIPSANGRLLLKLLVVLRESGDQFGPNVKKKIVLS